VSAWGIFAPSGSSLFDLAKEKIFRRICYILIATSATGGVPVCDCLLI